MQTFLPNIRFTASLRTLDNQRLGKQRVEALQILRALVGDSGWRNHPAITMWRGYETALGVYGVAACHEWSFKRGFADSVAWDIHAILGRLSSEADYCTPPWAGNLNFHRSHRSNLIRKDAARYGPLWPNTPVNMPYLWPREDRLYLSKSDVPRLDTGERALPEWLKFDPNTHEVLERES